MGDGISFQVEMPYKKFRKAWARALVGGRWHGFWLRFHRKIGVPFRRRRRIMMFVFPDGRRIGLNPDQICYIEKIT